ncbi:MAG: hypothetical protein AAF632_15220 [Bacteroidota bacterium]
MKYLTVGLVGLLLTACSTSQMVINVPANGTMELDYPMYDVYNVGLKNKSLTGLEVAVLAKATEEQVRGFGLGTKGKVDVLVERENKLVFSNSSNTNIKLGVTVDEKARSVFEKEGEYVSFTLQNTSAKSIPLIIPTVMNPNLSPFSKSGVDLKMGQEILFKEKGKRFVLLTVDESIEDSDVINVPELLEERKKELGL